jgi:dTDP-4-amino-4,6-dideoxygalactose transaminase
MNANSLDWPSWPSYSEEEVSAVKRVLESGLVNYWTGTECRIFEAEFASHCGVAHAVALANGSVAIELALKCLGIGPSDEVIVTPRSYFASVSSIILAGAVPVFADVDLCTQNITADAVKKCLTSKTRAVICVHLAGAPCDMDPILELASAHDLRVIEDCAQAHGARYKGRMVGAMGDVGAWSFCQDKIMTTGGEGGMVTTNRRDVWSAMWSYKDHGKSWDSVYNTEHGIGFRWLHESFGTNWRMTEMQGAIGRIQLTRLPEWTRLRQRHANRIWQTASSVAGLRAPELVKSGEHAAYKAYAFVEPETLKDGWNRNRIMQEVISRGVPCFSGGCPEIYLERAFDGTPWRPVERLRNSRLLGETSLMFLVHPTLGDVHLDKTCEVLSEVMRGAVR